jgi:hypothetical protein
MPYAGKPDAAVNTNPGYVAYDPLTVGVNTMYSSGVPIVRAGTPCGVVDVPLSAAAYAAVSEFVSLGPGMYILAAMPLTGGTLCTFAPAGIVTSDDAVVAVLTGTGTLDEPPPPPPPHAANSTQTKANATVVHFIVGSRTG